MFYRKDAAYLAIASLLASSGFAMADNAPKSWLTLDPTVITAADAAAPDKAPLMAALDKIGAAKPLEDMGLNIYGWVEAGYTYNHRKGDHEEANLPGPFNHEVGNHFMLNQVAIRFERAIADTTKFDVGGMIEVMYGTDPGFIHSSGMPFNGNDPTDDGSPSDPVADKYRANYQFDVSQAYLTINLPVGNGLQLMVGKFVTLLGYETVDPRMNAFYSHSWIFGSAPYSQTGVLGTYQVTDQFKVIAGITRGWDMTLEDTNGGIDGLGQFAYKASDQLQILLNWSVGPQNAGDNGHYRVAIDPIVIFKATDKLTLAMEGIYVYDGGLNQLGDLGTHAYGDTWGAAFYASYVINDMFTANARFEKFHSYAGNFGALAGGSSTGSSTSTVNVYSITLGVTVVPMPADPLLKNLSVRPEIRYDWSEDSVFTQHGDSFKDQLTFAADVIFKF